jgi:LysM repeat protein
LKLLFEIEENSMSRTKRGLLIASTMLLVAILASACEQPYSTPPAVTNTPLNSNSLFTTPIGTVTTTTPGSMSDLEKIATQTALAAVGTPVPGIATATIALPPSAITQTATAMIGIGPTATQAISASVPTSTSAPSGSKPATYVLKVGEFPYCIARRYNVDPDQLLSMSGLTQAEADNLSAGTVLTIPQSGSFVGDRSWHDHPATFTVGTTYNTNTVYGVACYYGDIEPSVIAQHNNISVDAVLTSGQVLNIP